MYAATLKLDHATQLRSNLAAVYASHGPALRKRASLATPDDVHSWDVVQEAFLHVLEHPPADVSKASLAAALDGAVRAICKREAKRLVDDAQLRIALRKRSL